MIPNGLGFAHRAPYLTPHFFRDKPVGRLLGPGITAEHLNDDTLGRTLDAIHAFGVEAFYHLVASSVVGQLGLGGAGGHLDATNAKGLKLTAVAGGRVAAQTRHAKKGRPAKGQEPGVVSYAIQGQLASRPDIHARQLQQKSAFIIATNDIDESILSDERVVEARKKDQRQVERGFRFLKDPLLMASTLFLKSPERIMALMAVMTLCPMVYAALEHRIRLGLEEHRQTFPDQKGHPAACPTARWVFLFTGIHVLLVGQITEVVLNLNTHHQTLLAILGEHHVDLYANSG